MSRPITELSALTGNTKFPTTPHDHARNYEIAKFLSTPRPGRTSRAISKVWGRADRNFIISKGRRKGAGNFVGWIRGQPPVLHVTAKDK